MQNYTEKYGFIYIWFDRKHKRYYIGSHWGSKTDGYVCSSTWMKDSFKRRPQDFKRRVLTLVSDKRMLLEEEIRWLSLIKKEELGKRYYNLSTSCYPRWQLNETTKKSVSEKISATMKAKHKDPEYRARYMKSREGLTTDHLNKAEVIAKRAATNRNKIPQELRLVRSEIGSDEHKQKLSAASNKRWSNPRAREKLRKCMINNKYYESRTEAAKEFNVTIATITCRLNSKTQKFQAWNWL